MRYLILLLLISTLSFGQGLQREVHLAQTTAATFNDAGSKNLVYANNGALYFVHINSLSDVYYRKSTNNGLTWGPDVVVFAGTATNVAIWYDRWTGLSSDYIHLVYTESATDDTLYRTINTGSSDALSTQTVIFAGASTATGGHLSVTRAVGGNVYCKTVIDAGAEGGFYRLPNANVPNGAWDAARTVDETIATTDQMMLVPDLTAADNQDIMAIFVDASANEISRKLYDDSGNSWSETSIATSITELVATTGYPNFNVEVDLTNSQILFCTWTQVDIANADLRFWTITNSAITEVTNVVLNSTDDQGLCAISINTDNNYWYVYYAGQSDGTETWTSATNIYYKYSTDAGTTWSAENLLTNTTYDTRAIYAIRRGVTSNIKTVAFYCNSTVPDVYITMPIPYSYGYGSTN